MEKQLEIWSHGESDIDGLIAIVKLVLFGPGLIPELKNAKIVFNANGVSKGNVIYVDICPSGVVADPEKKIWIFDHHPHDKWPGQTSSSLVDKFLGFPLLEHLELIKWAFAVKDTADDEEVAKEIRDLYDELDLKNLESTSWAFRGDFGSGGDPMNIANVIKRMHLLFKDEEVYQWFLMAVEAHFKETVTDFQKGIEFFKRTLEKFLSENKGSPAETHLQQWLRRAEKAIEDKMNIIHRAAVNLTVYGPEKTEQWLTPVFKSFEEGQRLFNEAEQDFKRAEKISIGRWVVVIGETKNRFFGQYCRSNIAKSQMPRPLSEREDPVVVQFQPENKGFQIFPNRTGYKLFDIAGALRVEILKARRREIPPDVQVLKAGGLLAGSEPLYYQKGDFDVLMWGSLKHPDVPPLDIPKELVVRIITIAIDQDYFPRDCQISRECLMRRCPLYSWRLLRCARKRRMSQT